MRRLVVSSLLLIALLALPSRAQESAAPPFFFVQFSDPQFGMFTADRDFAQETTNFEMAVATANRLRPAFVVVTGDLVNKPGDLAQIAEYRRIAARLDPAIPLHNVAGNHDVENVPTPASVEAYVRVFGRDYYSFRYGNLAGIVLNSSLIHSPAGAPDLAAAQERWLEQELKRARASGAAHIVVFQHHPWFLKSAAEPDEYFNIPLARRSRHLELFRASGVKYLMSGHYHRNALANDGEIQMITTGPVGKPLGDGTQSGMRVAIVTGDGITHRYYALGELPNRIALPK
jgi:3',5'-cyclic AMP phosphodiesterase CpdA